MSKTETLKPLRIFGAREHNLKNISLDLPRNRVSVITGLSGSGKSSLAFDTIYAEGQRRYVESLSAYARQFLESSSKPDVDRIEGLSPAISIEQKTASRNPRSTVGTVTEIYDYMRLLFARAGIPYSPATGLPIESQSVAEMVDRVLAWPENSRLLLLAPIARTRKGEYRSEMASLLKQGFRRIKIDGQFYDLEKPPKLDKNIKHDIDLVVDRIIVKKDAADRLADSFETALRLADGLAAIEEAEELPKEKTKGEKTKKPKRTIFSERFACPVSGFTIEEIEPRLFSFNSPRGCCPACDGLGVQPFADPELAVPDESLTINEGALAAWTRGGIIAPYYMQLLRTLAKHYGFDFSTPWKKIPAKTKKVILYGSGDQEFSFVFENSRRRYEFKKNFEGVLPSIDRRLQETSSNYMRETLSRYQSSAPCKECNGYRLRQEALCVKLAGQHVGEVTQLSVRDALDWFNRLEKNLSARQKKIASLVLREIRARLKFLCDVGLEYLTLARASNTLSGGESQRIRLASQIGSGLTGVIYVLDEPSIGLHPRDNGRLLESLHKLRETGNTVIIVEHDEDAILTADHVVDIGPGAGRAGGKIIAQGTPDDIRKCKKSLTGQYLSGTRSIPIPKKRRPFNKERTLKITKASGNNLKNINVAVPLGVFTCFTGVSGSGKSTLLIDTLFKGLARQLGLSRALPTPYEKIEGATQIDKIIEINQSPIGRTPRSNPATYTGAFTPIREWFAQLPGAKERGWSAGRFSFNVKGGRCEACHGDGVLKIEMHFLPDVYVTCDDCRGQRYNRETLQVMFRGKTIADVLDMTVEDAAQFFRAVPAIFEKLDTLNRVGLNYIRIGQQATTLSGGEAQRIKLAKELSRRATGRTFYILDEPTTGLHFHDIAKLLAVLQELVDSGNTIAIIEHNPEVMKVADWIIDLGPEGGNLGGKVLVTGTPEEVARHKTSYTAKVLRQSLGPRRLNGKG